MLDLEVMILLGKAIVKCACKLWLGNCVTVNP